MVQLNPGDIDWGKVTGIITAIVMAIVLVVIGLGSASVAGGVIKFILGSLNTSNVVIPESYNYLHQANPSLGTGASLLGILVIVAAAVGMIWLIMVLFGNWFKR